MLTRSHRRPTLAATAGATLVVAVGGLGLTGCAKTIDGDKIADDVASRQQWDESACKDGVEAKVGAKVACTGKAADGSPIKATVVVTAIDGDDVSYEIRPAK